MSPNWMGSPNHSPRNGTAVDTIVLHHSASSDLRQTVGWLCAKASKVSAHYVVGKDGEVYQLVKEEEAAWHAGLGRLPWETCAPYSFNLRSIGIELVNLGDGKDEFTAAQYRATGELLKDIFKRRGWKDYVVPAGLGFILEKFRPQSYERFFILGHRDIAHPRGRKTDPADNFKWWRLRAELAGGVS